MRALPPSARSVRRALEVVELNARREFDHAGSLLAPQPQHRSTAILPSWSFQTSGIFDATFDLTVVHSKSNTGPQLRSFLHGNRSSGTQAWRVTSRANTRMADGAATRSSRCVKRYSVKLAPYATPLDEAWRAAVARAASNCARYPARWRATARRARRVERGERSRLRCYLLFNTDVAAAHVDALAHFVHDRRDQRRVVHQPASAGAAAIGAAGAAASGSVIMPASRASCDHRVARSAARP